MSLARRRPSGGVRAPVLMVLALATLLSPTGCRRQAPAPPPASATDTVERGPLVLTASATPAEAWFGDTIRVELTLRTPRDYRVRFPTPSELPGVQAAAAAPRLPEEQPDGTLLWRQVLTIDALTAGSLEIPPIAVKYAREPQSPDTEPEFDQELVTGSLRITVKSALTSQDAWQNPRDIHGPIASAVPMSLAARLAWAAAALAAAGLLWAAFLLIRARLRRPKPPIPAEVWALRAMSELAARDLIGAGQLREYYYRLSEIVRGYIERKFALAAPDMTTEEFLRQLEQPGNRLPYDKQRLRTFLEACDIVKYAAYAPEREAADEALASARAFVHATAAAADRAAASTAGATT